MNLNDNLSKIRKNKRLTQNQLTELSGISKGQISKLESGKQRDPRIQTLIALATALECSVDEIVFGDNNPNIDIQLLTAIENLEDDKKHILREMMKAFLSHSMAEKLMKNI
jgi:transcriptional regulator with XRE-family HTH domain